MIPWQNKEPFYRRVYELFPGASFEHALILGAGTGSDTATALANGVKRITAVEIDPVIQKLGAQLHPDRPYSDPRVKQVNTDGRVFLRNTKEKYDLIIFALPDSLTLTSSIANLRLESFLFTQDSLGTARDALAPNGVLVLYNYYREPWLIEKLAGMVSRAFGQESFVSTYGGHGRGAVIINGPRLAGLKAGPYREDDSPRPENELRVTGEGMMPMTNRPARDRRLAFRLSPAEIFPVDLPQRLARDRRHLARRDLVDRAALDFAPLRLAHVFSRGRIRAPGSESADHLRLALRQHLECELARLLRHPRQRLHRRAGECAFQNPAHLDFLRTALCDARAQSRHPSGNVAARRMFSRVTWSRAV